MASDSPLAPDFIQFLFSTKPKFDCYFEVGNTSQEKPERIGAVKLMLMAHSEVFRLQLEDSDLKEKGDVPVKDVHPDTFKGMLKYVYGHDTTSDLCFDEADNLLYVAEKYLMKTLKSKLAVRLMKLLNTDNICSLLNNPACYTHLELDSAITEILRFETDHVLDSPQFLLMNPDGFLKILEQDGLAVPEIELWRAAIKWAKHRANSEDGQLVRQQLSGLTQHLRLCSLTANDICAEVVTTNVLTMDELNAVCHSVTRKRKSEGLREICNEVVPRKRLRTQNELKLTKLEKDEVVHCESYSFTVITKQQAIELLPLVCLSSNLDSIDPENRTHIVRCTTEITKVSSLDDTDSSYTSEPLTTVSFSEDVQHGEEFEIPLALDGRNITLLPNTIHTVKMTVVGDHKKYYIRSHVVFMHSSCYENDHLTLGIDDTGGKRIQYAFPSKRLHYRVTTAH